MSSEIEKKVEKIFTTLYEGYEKGNNWDKAMKEINTLFKQRQDESDRKLRSEKKVLLQQIQVTEKNLKKTLQEVRTMKKVQIPNLQREIIKLTQKNNEDYGSN